MPEVPTTLPVPSLSLSSLRLFAQCPEKWRRRYLLREYEPPNAAMVLGSSIHAAEAQNYSAKIDTGEDLPVDEAVQLFVDEWDDRIDREPPIFKEDEKPGKVKDQGILLVDIYHRKVAPTVVPTSVEREYRVRFDGADWEFTGYLDLEEADGAVRDLKVRKNRLNQGEADQDLQPAANLLARRAEGNPAPAFRFDVLQKLKAPKMDVVETSRTDRQLDQFAARIVKTAREIRWRAEYEEWSYAPPGAWWCSSPDTGSGCGYWHSCPGGGLS